MDSGVVTIGILVPSDRLFEAFRAEWEPENPCLYADAPGVQRDCFIDNCVTGFMSHFPGLYSVAYDAGVQIGIDLQSLGMAEAGRELMLGPKVDVLQATFGRMQDFVRAHPGLGLTEADVRIMYRHW